MSSIMFKSGVAAPKMSGLMVPKYQAPIVVNSINGLSGAVVLTGNEILANVPNYPNQSISDTLSGLYDMQGEKVNVVDFKVANALDVMDNQSESYLLGKSNSLNQYIDMLPMVSTTGVLNSISMIKTDSQQLSFATLGDISTHIWSSDINFDISETVINGTSFASTSSSVTFTGNHPNLTLDYNVKLEISGVTTTYPASTWICANINGVEVAGSRSTDNYTVGGDKQYTKLIPLAVVDGDILTITQYIKYSNGADVPNHGIVGNILSGTTIVIVDQDNQQKFVVKDSSQLGSIPAIQIDNSSNVFAPLINNVVPVSYLPAGVQQYIDVDTFANLPAVGDMNNAYITVDSGNRYHWNGVTYSLVNNDLALGITANNAYYGDKGKVAFDHSNIKTGNPHNVLKSEVGLGNVDNTSDANKPVSSLQNSAITAGDNSTLTNAENYTDAQINGLKSIYVHNDPSQVNPLNWIDISGNSPWASSIIQYSKNRLGVVSIIGNTVTNISAVGNEVVFTLPVGFRPRVKRFSSFFLATDSLGVILVPNIWAMFVINASGDYRISNITSQPIAPNTYFHCDIQFEAEQ